MPPMLIKIFGGLSLYLFAMRSWKIGASGAPSPPFFISFCLKL